MSKNEIGIHVLTGENTAAFVQAGDQIDQRKAYRLPSRFMAHRAYPEKTGW